MKIKLPLFRTIKCMPKGTRTEKHRPFGEWVEMEVKTPSEDEAPVATRVYNQKGHVELETRWFDGSHWYESDLTQVNLKQIGNKHRDYQIPSKINAGEKWEKNLQKLRNGELKPFVKEEMKSYQIDETSEVMAPLNDLIERSKDLLVVNGKLWQRGGDPVFLLQTGPDRPKPIDWDTRTESPAYSYFRLDAEPEHIAEFGPHRSEWFDRVMGLMPEVEILIPESLTTDVETLDFQRKISEEMNACWGAVKRDMEGEFSYLTEWRYINLDSVQLLTEICTELKAVEEGVPDASLESVADRVTEILPLYEHKLAGIYENLDRLVRRYNSRPILDIENEMQAFLPIPAR